jgi:catechol 2,3-dioxygenase-like lactoylglutathione lyase family enzyme
MSRLAHVALIVPDYDEAIAYYTGILGFELVEDTPIPAEAKRWVTIRPPRAPAGATCIVLAQAGDASQRAAIGNQAAGRVFLFLATDDFVRDHAAFTAAGVRFVEAPRHEIYGTVAVFEDRYGNRWDLLQLHD